MNVVRLVRYSCSETVSILKVLLSMAMQGRLRGLALCYRMDDGREESVFTGIYKEQPAIAASSCLRASMEQMKAAEAAD